MCCGITQCRSKQLLRALVKAQPHSKPYSGVNLEFEPKSSRIPGGLICFLVPALFLADTNHRLWL